MNFFSLFKAFDAAVALADAAKRFKTSSSADRAATSDPPPVMQGAGSGGQLEARLTQVVVAALKEAFDRDHARLELERAQLDEERRRAEAALRLELRRQAADRELARLRLLAGASMVGWIASVVMFAAGFAGGSMPARVALAAGWVLLLGALGAAFTAQGRVDASVPDGGHALDTAAAGAALWMLIGGLAATAVSLLL
jgi:hypothetical protein